MASAVFIKKMPLWHLFLSPKIILCVLSVPLLILSVSCVPVLRESQLNQDIVPSRGLYYGVQGRSALRHTMRFNVSCVFVDDAMRAHMRVPDKNGLLRPLPDLPCAMVLFQLENTGDVPLEPARLDIHWERGNLHQIEPGAAAKMLPGLMNADVLDSFFTMRRVLVEELDYPKIAEQTVRYNFTKIAPGDKVMFFRLIEYPPVRAKKFKIMLSVLDTDDITYIDFEFEQTEKRSLF